MSDEKTQVHRFRVSVEHDDIVLEFFRDRETEDGSVTADDELVGRFALSLRFARELADRVDSAVEHKENANHFDLERRNQLWQVVESLYGAWSSIDMDDDWLDKMRASNNERLADIYRDDTEPDDQVSV